MKEKIDYLYFIKIKNFYSVKDTVKRMKVKATHWEKIVTRYVSDKGVVSKIYKELLKLNNKKSDNPVKNGPKILTDASPKKPYRW